MSHQLVWQQGRNAFRTDVRESIDTLEQITGRKVKYFRAPGFSIRESEPWAFEELADLGIELDCSVFPAPHTHGGFPSYGKGEPAVIEYNGRTIKEFPVSTKEMLGRHVIYSGGGYFRLFPYRLIRHWARQSQDYLLSYVHPRDLDPGQPVLSGLSAARRFKSYVGLKNAEAKLRRFLRDFQFTDISTAANTIDWDKAKHASSG